MTRLEDMENTVVFKGVRKGKNAMTIKGSTQGELYK